MITRAALVAAGCLALTGCGDDVPDVVTFELTGTARADWRPDAAACLDPSWGWRVEPGATDTKATVTVPVGDYDESRTSTIMTCLRARPGVTWVDKPGYG